MAAQPREVMAAQPFSLFSERDLNGAVPCSIRREEEQ